MEYVMGEILLCLLAVGIIASVIGWLLHGVFGQGKLRALEAAKNREIENLQGELGVAGAAHKEAAGTLEKIKSRVKELEASLALSAVQLTEAKEKHKTEAGALTQKIASLEPLSAAVADRDARLEAWHHRFEGLVQDKDAELAEYKSKLASLGLSLAAAVAGKDALHEQLDAHRSALEAAGTAADGSVAQWKTAHSELSGKLAAAEAAHSNHSTQLTELTELLSQRDEQLKSFDQRMRGATAEKDTIIGKLRSMVSQIEPLRQDLQQRDQAIDQMQKRMLAMTPEPSTIVGPSAELEEAQRQINVMLATSASLKQALEGKDAEIAALAARATSFAAVESQAHTFQNQMVDLTGRHAAAKSELDDFATRQSALEARFRQQTGDFEASARGASAKQDEIVKVRAQLAHLDTQTMSRVSSLEKALDACLPREAKLFQTIEAGQAELAELRSQIAQRDQQFAREGMLENQVVDLSARHAAAKTELGDWTVRFAALEGRLRSQTSQHGAAAQSVGDKQTELDKSRAEVADLDAKLTTALSSDAPPPEPASDQRLAMLEKQVIDVTGRHAAAKSELDDWASRYADLEAKSRQLTAEYEAAARSLEAKQAELDKARAEVAEIDSKLITIPTMETELEDLRSQLVDRDEQLEAWGSRFHASVAELQGEIHALRSTGAQATMAAAAGASGSAGHGLNASAQRAEDGKQLKAFLADMSLTGVQFLPKSAELIPQALPILERAAEALRRFSDVSIEVGGHTDSWGMPGDNMKLSQQRAAAVKEYLINAGIPAWRLLDVGYGDTRPVDSNDTADGRFANRRIELRVKQ